MMLPGVAMLLPGGGDAAAGGRMLLRGPHAAAGGRMLLPGVAMLLPEVACCCRGTHAAAGG